MSHESSIFFISLSPTLVTWGFSLVLLTCLFYSVIHMRTQILLSGEEMINTRPTIPYSSLQFAQELNRRPWRFILSMATCGTLDEHLKHRRTRDPLQLFVSFASVTTIWDTRESCSHHHVVVCTIFLYSSLCYGREGAVLQLAYYTMLCGSAISHCEFFWCGLQCLR